MIIDWNKYFSHRFVVSGCKNFERRNWMDQELSRVGMNDFKYWYNFDDNKKLNYDESPVLLFKHKNVVYAHYSLIKTCYQLGYDNVLIMEDDICFLNNLDDIKNQLDIFNDQKNDVDIYLFDYWEYTENMIFCADCYYLNRKGMEYLIYMIENYHLNIDNYFYPKYLNGIISDNIYMTYYSGYGDNYNYIDMKIDSSLLPILLKCSPIHLCIQKFNTDINYNELLDISLYNK